MTYQFDIPAACFPFVNLYGGIPYPHVDKAAMPCDGWFHIHRAVGDGSGYM